MSAGTATKITIAIALLMVAVPGILYLVRPASAAFIVAVWLSGAAGLGLLSGYTTGASTQTGIAGEFLKFVSGGVLMPLVGGIATILRQPQTTIERSTYVGERLTEKTTEIAFASQLAHLYPLGILGGFVLLYSVFAIVGIRLGVVHREAGTGIKLRD